MTILLLLQIQAMETHFLFAIVILDTIFHRVLKDFY